MSVRFAGLFVFCVLDSCCYFFAKLTIFEPVLFLCVKPDCYIIIEE